MTKANRHRCNEAKAGFAIVHPVQAKVALD